MWRLGSGLAFYGGLVLGSAVFALAVDYLIVTYSELKEPWFLGICLFVYAFLLFIAAVVRRSQIDERRGDA